MDKIRKTFIFFIVFIIWSIICFGGGVLYLNEYGKKEPPKIVYKDKIVYKTIKRDYAKVPVTTAYEELKKYDTEPFMLDIDEVPHNSNMYRISGKLHKRKATRDVRLECKKIGNWKMYVGVGVVTAGVIYGGYKLISKN